MPPTIRLIFADDSVAARRFLTEGLRRVEGIEVVGVGKNGREAIELVRSSRPDVLLLDVEMPVMDGIDAVRALRQFNRDLPVVMFSSLTKSGCEATLDALAAGANDYASKPEPTNNLEDAFKYIRNELVPKIRQLVKGKGGQSTNVAAEPSSRKSTLNTNRPTPAKPIPKYSGSSEIVVIGSSTGGPNALAEMLPMVSGQLRVPVLIVQHMPTVFTKMLADRLGNLCDLEIREAVHGEIPRAGTVLIAPGGQHMELEGTTLSPKVVLHTGPEENSCRPAVDVLFRSVAALYREKALGVILTGMGKDGLEGCRHLAQKGSRIIAQDEESSVIWGMPRAVADAGLADDVLPLKKIAGAIHQYTPTPKSPVPAGRT